MDSGSVTPSLSGLSRNEEFVVGQLAKTNHRWRFDIPNAAFSVALDRNKAIGPRCREW